MSTVVFKFPDFEPVKIGDDFRIISNSKGKAVVTNTQQAFTIVSPTSKRHKRLIAVYQQQEIKPEPQTEIVAPRLSTQEEVQQEPVITSNDYIEGTESPVVSEAVNEEKFVPLPDEWFEVRVQHLLSNRLSLILSLTTGDSVICHPKTITESPGNHKLCLAPGTVGAARIELFEGRYRCIEAQFDGAPTATEEIGCVTKWDHDRSIGWVERPCGDWLFISSTDGREGTYGVIGLGDWIRFKIGRSRNPNRSGFVGLEAHKIDPPREEKV